MQLFETIHSFAEALNCLEKVDVITLDLSKRGKEFDSVSHTKLTGKLYGYNVNIEIIKWMHILWLKCGCLPIIVSCFAALRVHLIKNN